MPHYASNPAREDETSGAVNETWSNIESSQYVCWADILLCPLTLFM